jgi:hypothetical protein
LKAKALDAFSLVCCPKAVKDNKRNRIDGRILYINEIIWHKIRRSDHSIVWNYTNGQNMGFWQFSQPFAGICKN